MAKEMANLLTVQNLTKKFGPRNVLSDVRFNVRGGEVLGLIGPNGAGKTTLFECLAGLMPTSGGAVEFTGTNLPPGQRKQKLFYLPDAILPWADQTVKWALRFFERLYDSNAKQLARPLRLDELMNA